MRKVFLAFMMLSALGLVACSAKDSSSTVTVTGRVMRHNVTPPAGVPGVQVTATMVNEPANPGEIVPSFPPVVGTTDAEGRFTLEVPLSGVVDDPANPSGLVPAVGLPISLKFQDMVYSGSECDTTGGVRILWDIYTVITATRIFQLQDEGTLDIGVVPYEELTQLTEFRYGTPGGC